ncbi:MULTISPECIES: class I SAM-dependent methyltransferase [unclassified Rhizobium]|uniref:class I SAM-dependent methyltransferase n=1 Tax=unclassified Rhizobium TaxID=2613769 RepID=UPI000714FF3A|nr:MULTISPECIES: class I SAM-dependent methyltransferase [unclassified Rhizobium]KQS87722.1 methyltransferase type 12 [Rhizobium sp. Leaf391]KQT07158.1 methyltransferase type 12 [Rhizobium sp. Leaf386]KQT95284.1 methyltransferase type 12 [Rhizobium sp. Leaf453]
MDDYLETNRFNWDDRAGLHATDPTDRYRIERVLAGGSSLHALEASEIGDIVGKDVVHLQCHIGLDTLSLRHLGARSVTGLDFSPIAIASARDFARKAGTEARFVEASVYDAVAALENRSYDIVYVTWGAIHWLPDIFGWAKIVAGLLRPGGRLYLLDGHPQMFQYKGESDGRLTLIHGWRTPVDAPLLFEETHTYTGDERPLIHQRMYEWLHPVSDVVNALLQAGMRLDFLNEHEILTWRHYPGMIETGEEQFEQGPGLPRIPLSFSIGATKPA